jgi:hypothetical protein
MQAKLCKHGLKICILSVLIPKTLKMHIKISKLIDSCDIQFFINQIKLHR